MFIVLTQEQAESVETAQLKPRDLGNGVFILPLAVLKDPTHEAQWPILKALPQEEVELPEPDDAA